MSMHMHISTVVNMSMEPVDGDIDLARTALLIIDMQKDFLQPSGFGEMLGNDVSKLSKAIGPCKKVLEAARAKQMLIIHTREVSGLLMRENSCQVSTAPVLSPLTLLLPQCCRGIGQT